MPKAKIELPNGTVVTIDGTPEDVAKLLKLYSSSTDVPDKTSTKKQSTGSKTPSKPSAKSPKGPMGHIRVLIDEGFFKSRKSLADIQKKLEEKGHIYAQSSLSPALVRLVRNQEVRRLKESKGWAYVNK